MKSPYNLRVVKYLNGCAEIAWNCDFDLSDNYFFNIYVTNTLGIESLFATSRSNSMAILGEYISTRVTLTDGMSESGSSNILSLAAKNASDINSRVIIGQDESGQARMLAVTPEGVLKVTGATVTNTGGDASAANQITQISIANNSITKLNTAISELQSILTKLESLGLNATTVNALKSVSISNLPSNYPDSDAASMLASIFNKIPGVTDTSAIRAELLKKLNFSDLNIDLGKNLGVIAQNMPSDFPDSALNTKAETVLADLLDLKSISNDIGAITHNCETLLIELRDAMGASNNHNANSNNSLGDLLTAATLTMGIINDVLAVSQLVNALIQDIKDNTNGLIKASDLAINADKSLNASIVNTPTDYPDSATISALNNTNNYLNLISQGLDVNLTNALPAGSNLIGQVAVTSLPLPDDAARDSSLALANTLLTQIGNAASYCNTLGMDIRNTLTSLSSHIKANMRGPKLLFNQHFEFAPNTDIVNIRLLELIDISYLNSFNEYKIEILSYDNAGSLSVFRESAVNNKIYLHKICQKELATADILNYTHKASIQNISLSFRKLISNAAMEGVSVAIYGVM